MNYYLASQIRILITSVFSYLSSATALVASEVSINGADFQPIQPPISIFQDGRSNSVSIVEEEIVSDSAVIQTGFYNRTAIFQFGNDKLAILRQPGRYNRALIIQVADTEQDIQSIDARQGAGTSSTNYLFTLQTSVNDANPIAQEFSLLTFNEAKAVAKNFIYAPELSRVNVGLLEDISLHFSSLLANRLDQNRLGSCAAWQSSERLAYGDGKPINNDPICSSAPFFAVLGYGRADRDSVLGLLGYEQGIRSVTVGGDFRIGPLSRLGVAFNVEESDSDIREGLGRVNTTGYQIGGFGSISQSQYYLDFIATLGKVNFTSDRFGGTTKVRSDVDGWSYTGRVQAGYFFGQDNFRVGPLLAGSYSKGSVDSYWEKGSVLMTQWIEKQDQDRFVGSVGAAFDHRDSIGGIPLHSYLKLELERDFGIGGQGEVESRFAFSPDVIVYTPVDDNAKDTYGRISGGLSLALNKQVKVSLMGMTLVGADRLNRQNIYGELSVGF